MAAPLEKWSGGRRAGAGSTRGPSIRDLAEPQADATNSRDSSVLMDLINTSLARSIRSADGRSFPHHRLTMAADHVVRVHLRLRPRTSFAGPCPRRPPRL